MSSMSLTTDDYGRSRHHNHRKQFLLEKMGGEAVLGNMIKNWYPRILEDDELLRFYRNADIRKIVSHQYELL